eukprot:756522-Hanusia_phi.AAC.4
MLSRRCESSHDGRNFSQPPSQKKAGRVGERSGEGREDEGEKAITGFGGFLAVPPPPLAPGRIAEENEGVKLDDDQLLGLGLGARVP